jgi:hypothetical protein
MSTNAKSAANYPSVNFTGACGEATSTPNYASSSGMQPYQTATVNGNPTSNCIVGNDGATVFSITLVQTTGAYAYQVLVDGQGPSGAGSGSFYLGFTDASGDTYYLSIYSSTRAQHTVDYNSTAPNIVTIWWCDESFPGLTNNAAKADFRVTSPANV